MHALLLVSALAQPAAAAPVPLFNNLGTFHRTITTAAPRAQQYFDQGLRLTYAFNHAEAVRAYQAGIRVDSTCAMCWWGMAYALGPNINAPMDSAAHAQATAAIAVAQIRARAGSASSRERAFIEALASRYGGPLADQARRDSVWAREAQAMAERFPDDDEAVTLAADAAMNLRPWNYWREDGTPYPGTGELVARLERVIGRSPNHPGACHLYIHAIEAVAPANGVPCAERLAALMPGAGHLVHMPAHIYVRVGRFADAVQANRHAVHADETYIAQEGPTGLYPSAYYPHNYHFLAFAATFAGMAQEAVTAAAAASAKIPLAVARDVGWTQPITVFDVLTLQVFGRWEEILDAPMPGAELPLAVALVRFARGMAQANLGHSVEADSELAGLRALLPGIPEGELRTSAEIGLHVLTGEIARRRGRVAEGIAHLTAAQRLEDGLPYQEPPYWHQPVRHLLGAALLDAGRPAEAERAYREDLERFPGNGWSLFGLAVALRAQGRVEEAVAVDTRFREAWKDADVRLQASRF